MSAEPRSRGDASPMSAPPGLGDLERDVMEIVWDGGEATVREVLRTLNAASERERAYTTVMTVMGNLRRKGLLACRREERADVYSLALSREAYIDARARVDVEAVVSQYGDVALVHFAREVAGLDAARRKRLRALADAE